MEKAEISFTYYTSPNNYPPRVSAGLRSSWLRTEGAAQVSGWVAKAGLWPNMGIGIQVIRLLVNFNPGTTDRRRGIPGLVWISVEFSKCRS